jgi:myo-inositol-1(or 4)-monophosphatase
MAAGVLLVREAGGLVGDFSGGHDFLQTGNIVAAAPKLFPLMLREIRPHLSEALPC